MKNKTSILSLLVLCTGAAAVFFVGPSFFIGGPTKADIRAATIEVMGVVEGVTITPKGLCSKQADLFACIVEVVSEGAAPETFVIEIEKDPEGNWTPAAG